jgi:uncharacterized protein
MAGRNKGAEPVAEAQRSALLDSLRGWALLGILLANMMIFSGWVFLRGDARSVLPAAGLDDLAELLAEWLVIGKFYALFSLLFGIGFAIQIERLQQRGEGSGRYLRRLLFLFLIGIAHILLLWMGDIVALYALMGAFLLLFRRLSDRAVIRWAIVLWLVPIAWSAAYHFLGFRPSDPLFGAAFGMLGSAGIDLSQGPIAIFSSPVFLDHLRTHPAEAIIRLADLLYQMRFTKVLGMFLFGLWIGRRAIHARPEEHRALLRKVATWGLALGLPLSLAKAVLAMWPGDEPLIAFAAEVFYCLGTPTLALGYAAAFTLLWVRGRSAWTAWAAPAGRMALTNYLMQTVLQSILFYGWGFGLVGRIGLALVVPISIALFALQIAYSRWWLLRFRFGPVEWLWRSLTYGRRQPMLR